MLKECPRGTWLGDRDREILSLIADGKSDIEIGMVLNISSKTVNYHVENVKRVFGVHTRIQAVVTALRRGVIF